MVPRTSTYSYCLFVCLFVYLSLLLSFSLFQRMFLGCWRVYVVPIASSTVTLPTLLPALQQYSGSPPQQMLILTVKAPTTATTPLAPCLEGGSNISFITPLVSHPSSCLECGRRTPSQPLLSHPFSHLPRVYHPGDTLDQPQK